MTYFPDLSDYEYSGSAACRAGTKNIGWLGCEHAFNRCTPTPELLDALWDYCTVSVAQTRGVHQCELCPSGEMPIAERYGKRLLLGTSEIRVFGKEGRIYAAPTLIYHYISVHGYAPPGEFVNALRAGPRPPDPRYFARLEQTGLEWNMTTVAGENTKWFGVSPSVASR